jgi:hypothetical protein
MGLFQKIIGVVDEFRPLNYYAREGEWREYIEQDQPCWALQHDQKRYINDQIWKHREYHKRQGRTIVKH